MSEQPALADQPTPLLREMLSPQHFRTAWAQALTACFEQAVVATTASRQTAHLLAVAAQGEKGLVAQVKFAIDSAARTADAKVTNVTAARLTEFEMTLSKMTAVANQQIADSTVALLAAADAAQAQRKEMELLVLDMRSIHLSLRDETAALKTEREALLRVRAEKPKHGLLSRIFKHV